MLKFLQKRGTGARILLGFVAGVIGLAMVITLLPGSMNPAVQSADAVAQVGDRTIFMAQVQAQLRQITEGRQIPPALQAIYAEQVIDNLVFDEMLELEAERNVRDTGFQYATVSGGGDPLGIPELVPHHRAERRA